MIKAFTKSHVGNVRTVALQLELDQLPFSVS